MLIGTAGHVDHGKTLLVKALTGIDADRLPEEKARGLTIDIGFAHFSSADGEIVGVVDVPGHERFIRNMVAGAWGINCGLLIVAADEGWMNQTQDHVRVLSFLNIPRLIIAITKCDLASDSRIARVESDALTRCRSIGGWDPTAVRVSALQGTGIEELKSTILRELQNSKPDQQKGAHVYVDRVFSVSGAGTVVTGTLREGSLAKNSEVIILPEGSKARIRTIQSYYSELDHADPVSRVALNLQGKRMNTLARGSCIVPADSPFEAVGEFIAQLDFDEQRKRGDQKRHFEAEIAVGTGHFLVVAHLQKYPLLAHFVSSINIPLRWGQRFVLIRKGGSDIICGGTVLFPGKTDRAFRRSMAELMEKNELTKGPPPVLEIAVNGYTHLNSSQFDAFFHRERYTKIGNFLFDTERLTSWKKSIIKFAGEKEGTTISGFVDRVLLSPEVVKSICDDLVAEEKLLFRGDGYYPLGSQLSLSPFGKKVLSDLRQSGKTGVEPSKLKVAGLQKELKRLTYDGMAVSLEGKIYLSKQIYEQVAREIVSKQASGTKFTIAQARDRTGLSRRYLIPLLVKMEEDGLVRREDDVRVIL